MTPEPVGLSPRARWAGALLFVALQTTLLWIYYQPATKGLVGDEVAYLDQVARIEATGEASDPLRAVLYPHLLATLGVGPGRRWPVQALQLLLLVAAAWMLRGLARDLLGAPRAGDLAAFGMLLYPTLGAFAHYLWPEILHLTLWIGVLWILGSGRRSPPWLALAGGVLAIALLTRHLLLPFAPLVPLLLLLERGRDREGRGIGGRVAARRAAWFATPLLVILLPALWIDGRDDGRLRVRSDATFNLWVGLNDAARRSFDQPIAHRELRAYLASADTAVERDELLAARVAELLRQRGVMATLGAQLGRQYFRLFDRETFFTQQLPGGALHGRRSGYRTPAGPLPRLLRWIHYTAYALLLCAATWGIVSLWPLDSPWLRLMLLFIAYNLAILLMLHVKSRYRLQLVPFLVLFAAVAIDRCLAGNLRLPAPRAWLAAGVSGLALLLAFGGDLL